MDPWEPSACKQKEQANLRQQLWCFLCPRSSSPVHRIQPISCQGRPPPHWESPSPQTQPVSHCGSLNSCSPDGNARGRRLSHSKAQPWVPVSTTDVTGRGRAILQITLHEVAVFLHAEENRLEGDGHSPSWAEAALPLNIGTKLYDQTQKL